MTGLAALLAASAPAAAAERRYSVTDFDRVVVEGPYIVSLATGASSAATATGGQAALDRMMIDVSGRTLRIRRSRTYWGGNPGALEGPPVVVLTTRTLRGARLIGPASLEVSGAEGLRVDFSVEGSGRLRATRLDADTLSLGLAGSGRLEIAGTAETVNADIQGTGDLEASGLQSSNAVITTTTTGTIALAVERSVTVTALGLGTVAISGRPACTLRGPNTDLVRCGSDQGQRGQPRP